MVISIVIRALNEDHHIGRLIDGIHRQNILDDVSIEIILVDSGSTDSTVAIAESMGARIVRIPKEDFSFGRALNIGCDAAKGEILVFASAHVYPVYDDWLEKMILPFENKKVALVYGKQMGNEVTRFSEHQVFKQWFPDLSNYNQQTPFCNNANCAIRKDLWLTQHYDEELTGLEDLDWADKIKDKGFRIVYESNAPVIHVHEETAKKIKMRYQREAIAIRRIFPKVHFNRFDFLRHLSSSVFHDCLEALKKNKLLREFKGILVFRLMQYQGTYHGHNQSGQVTKELKTRFYYPVKSINLAKKKKDSDGREHKKIKYS